MEAQTIPAIDDLAGLTGQEERLVVALWSGHPRALSDIQQTTPEFARASLATLERYARNLSDKLEQRDGWRLEFGRTVTHGKWLKLIRPVG